MTINPSPMNVRVVSGTHDDLLMGNVVTAYADLKNITIPKPSF